MNMTPLGLVKLKSARDAMLASPWRWSISCTQKMRMSSPFFHVLNVMTSLDFVTFFEMSLSLCIQTAFELKIWRAFCVSGDTFSISNLHRIQMDNFSKLLIKQESYNPDMNFPARFILFYASCKNQVKECKPFMIFRKETCLWHISYLNFWW